MHLNAITKCRHRIPKHRHRLMNWPAYEANLRQRGSLTVRFTGAANAGGRVKPRTSRGGQFWYSPLAILTALTLRTVFRLALRQTVGLIGSVIRLFGLDLPVPDHTTMTRRADRLDVQRLRCGTGAEFVPLLMDSTGLKLCGTGEWLIEEHGIKTRRSWRKLHIGMDAERGEIVAVELRTNDVDDPSQVGPLLGQVTEPVASFTGDGTYDQDGVCRTVANHHAQAVVIVPPCATAIRRAAFHQLRWRNLDQPRPAGMATTERTQRDRHLQCVAEKSRIGWQKALGYKSVAALRLQSHKDGRQTTEDGVAIRVLNRMLELGRPPPVRIV
jgi:hypothetical protein